jgi:hypothetical protein
VTLKLAALVLTSALALPGWGGDDRGDKDADARAERIVLRKRDLPAGWRAQADDEDPEAQIDLEELSDCDAVNADLDGFGDPSGSATSPSYESPSQRKFASGSVNVFAEQEVAEEGFDLLSDGCLTQILADTLSQGEPTDDSAIGDVDTQPLDVPELGDASVGGRVVAEIRFSEGGSLDWIFDIVMIREDDVVATLVTSGVGEAFPDGRRDRILERVAGRMK